jgi:hypothetical protein
MNINIVSYTTIYPPAGHIGNNFTFELPALASLAHTTFQISNLSDGLLFFNLGSANVLPTGPTVMGCDQLIGGQVTLVSYPDWDSGLPPKIGITLCAPCGSIAVANVYFT